MKLVAFIKPVIAVDRKGNYIDLDGKPSTKPVHITDQEFMLERTYDQGICGSRVGWEQIRFTESIRACISAQLETVESKGFWELEDEHYQAIRKFLEGGTLNQALLHNLIPFVRRFFE